MYNMNILDTILKDNHFMKRLRGQPKKENKKKTISISLDPIIHGIVSNAPKDNEIKDMELKKDFNRSNFLSILVLYFYYNQEIVKKWLIENKDTLKKQI